MPANLTPEYIAAEQDFKEAATPDEKVAALERMLSTIPKHKGTEKLQADIKRRLSRMRKESAKKGGPRHAPYWIVKREGAGQVALLGPPNSGKSSLLAALTHAHPDIADYPFTTRTTIPGMMSFEDVRIQLLDLPAISAEFTQKWIPQVVRMADLEVLVVDLHDAAVLEEIEFILEILDRNHISTPNLLLGNKIDLPGSRENLEALRDLYGDRFRYLPVSAHTAESLDRFARRVFEDLRIVRFYSKPPGKPAELDKPYTLRQGATIMDAARAVHKDFAEKMKFTRLYHVAGGRSGLPVERTHVVEDRDILEFHI